MNHELRRETRSKALPVCLDDVAADAHKVHLDVSEPLTLHVTELIARFEEALQRTLVDKCTLVKRNVLDSERLDARHLPLCPEPSSHKLLPHDKVDCVALCLDYDVSFSTLAVFVLRVRARPGLITGEIYISSAQKAVGMVLGQFVGAKHLLAKTNSFGGSEYRGKHPDNPRIEADKKVKESAKGVLHIVHAALEAAALPLLEQSAKSRMTPNQGKGPIFQPPPPVQPNVQAPGGGTAANPGTPPKSKVKRRSEDDDD